MRWGRFLILVELVLSFNASADALSSKSLYWPFLANGYSTYHADAYRSDSTPIEPALKYVLAPSQGPKSLVFVSANIDYDLEQNYFPAFGTPTESKIYSYYQSGSKDGQLAWNDGSLGVKVDECALPWSVSIDAEHHVYFSDCRYLYSATSQGALRWKAPLPRKGAQISTFIEVFFTAQGDVGGITNFGVLALYDRQTGRLKLQFQIPNIYGSDLPVTDAILNAPASMLDPNRLGVTRVFVTGTMNQDPDGDGVRDLGVFRIDVSYNNAGKPSATLVFASAISNGNKSATTPTIAPSGLELYLSDQTSNDLLAVSTTTGAIRWRTYVGKQQGSVATSRDFGNLVFTGAGNRQLAIVDPKKPATPTYRDFSDLAEKYVPPLSGVKRAGIISTNILATPTKLLFVVTVGYETSEGGVPGPLFPKRAFLVMTSHSGTLLGETEIPTTSDVTLSLRPDGTVFIPSADIQARLALVNMKKDPQKYAPYGPPISIAGGVIVLKPVK